MNQKELSELTDQELLAEAKKMKSSSIIHAGLIGFMIGIILYSVLKKQLGTSYLNPFVFYLQTVK